MATKKKKIQKTTDDELIKELNYKMNSVKKLKEDEIKKEKEQWAQFSGQRNDKKLHIQKTYVAVWVSLAKFINFFLGQEPLYDIQGRGTDESDRLEAQVKTAGMNYEIGQIPDFQMAFIKHIMQHCIHGGTALKTGWEDEKEGAERTGLTFPFILNRDIYFDSTALLNSQIRWVHQRVVLDKDFLEAKKDWNNVTEYLKNAQEYRKEKEGIEDPNPYRDMFEVFDCWTKEKHIIAGSVRGKITHIFKQESNPFNHKKIPYIFTCFDPVLEDIKGMGIPESMKDAQNEINAQRRLRIQALELAILGLWAYKPGTAIVREVFKNPSAGAFPLSDFTAIQKLDIGRVPPYAFMEEAKLDTEIEDITATYRPVRGAEMPRAETLGGIQLLQASGNERQLVRLMIFCTSMVDVGRMMLKNLFQFQKKEHEVKIYDGSKAMWEKAKFSDKEAVEKEYNLVLRVSPTTQPKEVRQVLYMKLIEVLQKIPYYGERRVDWDKLGEIVLSVFDEKLPYQIQLTDEVMGAIKKIPPEELKEIIAAGIETLRERGQIGEGISEGGIGEHKRGIEQTPTE